MPKNTAARFAAATSILALAVAMGGTGYAASGLITGKNIKDNTVTGKDVKDKSLSAKDFSGSVQALAGPAGPAGPAAAVRAFGSFDSTAGGVGARVKTLTAT